MALPNNVGVCREGEKALDCLTIPGSAIVSRTSGGANAPDLDVSSTINPRPDAKHVLTTSHAQDSATDFFSSLGELIADDGK